MNFLFRVSSIAIKLHFTVCYILLRIYYPIQYIFLPLFYITSIIESVMSIRDSSFEQLIQRISSTFVWTFQARSLSNFRF